MSAVTSGDVWAIAVSFYLLGAFFLGQIAHSLSCIRDELREANRLRRLTN